MLSSEEIRTFWDCGFLVRPGLGAHRVASLRAEFQRLADQPQWGGAHVGRRFGKGGLASSHRFGGLLAASEPFAAHAADAVLVAEVQQLLGPVLPFRDVLLSKPARSGGRLGAHQDLAYWDLPHDRVLTAWLALSRVTVDSGALWLLPGTHRRVLEHRNLVDGRPVPRPLTRALRALVSLTGTGDSPTTTAQRSWASLKEATLELVTRRWPWLTGLGDLEIPLANLALGDISPVEAEPGDIVLFHGLTVHGSTENRLDTRRDAYLVTYASSGPSAVSAPRSPR